MLPRWVERGTVSAVAREAPEKLPKIATSDPGATGDPRPFASLAKLAALSTPPGATEGGCAETTRAPSSAQERRRIMRPSYGRRIAGDRADGTGFFARLAARDGGAADGVVRRAVQRRGDLGFRSCFGRAALGRQHA